MSGVYIPDMGKPKCCFLCPLCYGKISTLTKTGYCRLLFEENEAVDGGQTWRTISDVTELADFCPLIAVPDHGRLIDADALADQMAKRRSYVGRLSDPLCLIEDAPTTIEAEGENNG